MTDFGDRALTPSQLDLLRFRQRFVEKTRFGEKLLRLFARSDVGVWRYEQDQRAPERWWLHITLPASAAELFDLKLELLVLYTEYSRLEPRTLEQLQRRLRGMRLEPDTALVVSRDPGGEHFASRRRGDVNLIAINADELDTDPRDLRARIAAVVTAVDHFDQSQPPQTQAGFFGRKVEFDYLNSSLDRGQSVGVFGLRKAGKTSLQLSIQRARQEAGRLVVRIDLSRLSSDADFKLTLLQEVWTAVLKRGETVEGWTMPRLRLLDSDGEDRDRASEIDLYWARDLEALLKRAGTRLELFIDEIDQAYPTAASNFGDEAWQLFRTLTQLRGLVQQSEGQNQGVVLFCLGVNPALFESPLIDGRDNLLYKLVRLLWLSPMPIDEMREMVRTLGRRMGVRVRDAHVIDTLYHQYGGHPLLTRTACSLATRGRSMEELPFDLSVGRLQRALDARGQSSPHHMAAELIEAFRSWFPNEADLLALSNSSEPDESAWARDIITQDPLVVEHAVFYGLLNDDRTPRINAAFS